MSKRSDLLLACMLGNRWQAGKTSVNASVQAASPTLATQPQSRIHLENIWYSIKNYSYSTGIQYTVSLQIRGAGNTVFQQIDHVLLSSTVQNVSISKYGFAHPKLGAGLSVAFSTTAGSVTQSINATGWIEDTNG